MMSHPDDVDCLKEFRTILDNGVYAGCAGTALLAGAWSVVAMVAGVWVYAFLFFSFATLFRLAAGAAMNWIGDAATVNAWNNRYHRVIVMTTNAVVGGVFLIALIGHKRLSHALFLGAVFVFYFAAARFTRPNTFGARVRSAALTVVLLGTMAHLAWSQPWGLCALAGVITLNIVLLRLRALQYRFGWANR